MKVFIEDLVRNINVTHEGLKVNDTLIFFNHLSENDFSEIRIFILNISKYKIKINFWGPYGWKIDYPIKLREVHKQCYATKEQCMAIIRELYEVGNIDDVPGFIEVPIRDFTLDEMLEFKKEEEMILKGLDLFTEEDEEDLNIETVPLQEQKEVIKQPEIKTVSKTPKKSPLRVEKVTKTEKDTSSNYFEL